MTSPARILRQRNILRRRSVGNALSRVFNVKSDPVESAEVWNVHIDAVVDHWRAIDNDQDAWWFVTNIAEGLARLLARLAEKASDTMDCHACARVHATMARISESCTVWSKRVIDTANNV